MIRHIRRRDFSKMHFVEYEQRNHKLAKMIIDYYGHRFFINKKILDLGCFNGELANAFARIGGKMTAVDARQEHIDLINKKYPYIKTVLLDLDKDWPFADFEFDVVLSLGTMCHLKDYELHLNRICSAAETIVLETEVFDKNDHSQYHFMEDKAIKDLSFNGEVNIIGSNDIQNKLSQLGATFRRIDETKLNTKGHAYDWKEQGLGRNERNRRLWFIRRDKHIAAKVKNAQQASEMQRQAAERAAANANTVEEQRTERTVSHNGPRFNPSLIINTSDNNQLPHIASPIVENFVVNHNRNYNKTDKKFVIVIPSYKNEQWCEKNIQSALDQNYLNFRVIFTDDCSPDNTFDKVSNFVNSHRNASKAILIKNTNRLGALENLYNMIVSCNDDEIILTLDGDDWFPDNDVLNKLNKVYSENDVWLTYGQYRNTYSNAMGHCRAYEQGVINSNSYRSVVWNASHLRTFYTWLFKRIRKEDLMQNGKFFSMTWDFAIMFPMLEMSGGHFQYIPDVLYIYNDMNPINDHKVNRNTQAQLDRHIRSMPRYPRTEKPVFAPPKTRVGLLLIATGKYHKFIQGIVSSADKFFFNDQYDVSYYVFSDAEQNIQSSRRVENIHIDHKPFPFASMDRFKHFTNNADRLKNEDYLYYVDVDCLFVDNVKEEILGNLVGVRHCGFYKGGGPYEKREGSTSFVHPSKYKHYYGGGFSGGRAENYLALAKWCSEQLDIDTNKGIIPIWHDESILQKYFSENIPSVILSPSYHYPQGNIARYQGMWSPDTFKAKILLLDKNHHEIRK